MGSYKSRIAEFLREDILDPDIAASVEEDDNLLLSGTLDSLGVMRLVAFIEHDLGVSVPPEDVTLENFRNLDTMSGYLERRNGSSEPVAGE